jgi:hypothetical protein
LEAGLRAAEEAVVSVPTYYNNSLKNGIWRRVSALSKLMKAIDILGPEKGDEENANTLAPHDSPCHTTYEAVEQRPPLNPIFATAAVRRGIGRKGKCGRKRKADRVPMAEDKDKKTKGVDSRKDNMEVVKSVLAFALNAINLCVLRRLRLRQRYLRITTLPLFTHGAAPWYEHLSTPAYLCPLPKRLAVP